MALTGLFKKITWADDTTYYTSSITYPVDLPEDDPNYELRGQSAIETVPVGISSSVDYPDSYVVINHYNLLKTGDTSHNLDIFYRVYGSEASKSADFDNFLVHDVLYGNVIELSGSEDVRTKAYDLLKILPQFSSMTNA